MCLVTLVSAVFIQAPVPTTRPSQVDPIHWHMGVSARAETSVISLIGCYPATPHLVGGNYYADKLLFSNYLSTAVTFAYTYGQLYGDQLCLV